MDDDLAAFLDPLTFCAREEAVWGPHRLCLTYYLAEEQPPLPCVTSSRAVLVDGDDVLVVRDPGGSHVMPGGRLEAGESKTRCGARYSRKPDGQSPGCNGSDSGISGI